MRLEEGWVPVALSSSIEAGTSAGVVVGGQEIVVWRDNSSKAHVWEDRCPHRGMRLSFGFVRGDHIACLYHGWQYDTAGQCRLIPAHPALDVPATIKVPIYHATEMCGIIWATAAPDAVLPGIDGAVDVTPVRSLFVDCPVDVALASLAEIGFVSIGGQSGIVSVNGDRLLIGIQSIKADRTALHIVILGPSAISAAAKQKHYAHWAETLRSGLEAGPSFQAEVA